MAALSDLMLAFMNQLGLETVGVCGQHTGAAMAAELARRHPSRVLALALDGIPCSTRKNVKQFCRINCTASCRRQMGAT